MSDKELLKDALYKLDDALSVLMEMNSDEGKALAAIIHGALVFGELLENAKEISE